MPTVFEVSGRRAMFRRPYTTTSSVSSPFPPPSALAGMIAAVLGFDKGSDEWAGNALFWRKMGGTQVALRIMNPVSWYSSTISFINTKDPQNNLRILVKHQMLRNPRYRIYVKGALEEQLDWYLRNQQFVYTPYLGVAYALCKIEYLGRFEEEPCVTPTEVDSVIPFDSNIKIDTVATDGILKERMTLKLNSDRSLDNAVTVLFRPWPDHGIVVEDKGGKGGIEITKCGDDTVAWFPAW